MVLLTLCSSQLSRTVAFNHLPSPSLLKLTTGPTQYQRASRLAMSTTNKDTGKRWVIELRCYLYCHRFYASHFVTACSQPNDVSSKYPNARSMRHFNETNHFPTCIQMGIGSRWHIFPSSRCSLLASSADYVPSSG